MILLPIAFGRYDMDAVAVLVIVWGGQHVQRGHRVSLKLLQRNIFVSRVVMKVVGFDHLRNPLRTTSGADLNVAVYKET